MTARVEIDAVLDLTVEDGAGGRAAATVTSEGDTIRVSVDRPDVFLSALPRRGVVAFAVSAAHGLGVRVELRGPRGLLAVLDPDRPDRLARLLTGGPALRPTAAGAAAWMQGPGRAATQVVLGVIAATVAAVAVGAVIRRRGPGP